MKLDTKLFQWTREPAAFALDADKVEIITKPHTDLWQRTYYIPGQKEVVHLPGTKLHIVSVTTANDGNPLIYAQEVNKHGKGMETNYGGNEPSFTGANKERQAGNAGGKGNDVGGVYQHRGMERDGEAINGLPVQQPGRLHQTDEVKDHSEFEEQNQERKGTITDWDVLEQASSIVGGQSLTVEQQTALDSFNNHLEKVKKLSAQKAEQYSILDNVTENEEQAVRNRIATLTLPQR